MIERLKVIECVETKDLKDLKELLLYSNVKIIIDPDYTIESKTGETLVEFEINDTTVSQHIKTNKETAYLIEDIVEEVRIYRNNKLKNILKGNKI